MDDDEVLPVEHRLSRRYRDALVWAAELHDGQSRKGTTVPYVSHVLAVSGLVLEHDGTEDQAIAALLHDVIEDCGVPADEIEARFGSDVARIVLACSDTDEIPKPPWRERKRAYLARLPTLGADVLLVSLADKVHNLRTLVEDIDREGEATLSRFRGGADGTRWYYRRLADVYAARTGELPAGTGSSLLHELDLAVHRLGATPAAASAYEATATDRPSG